MIIDFTCCPPYKSLEATDPSGPKYPVFSGPRPTDSRHISPWNYDNEPSPSRTQRSMELFLSEMDEAGISQVVVDCPYVTPTPPEGRRRNNDDIAELVKLHPTRFQPFGAIDLTDVPLAINELERVVCELGFKGVAVNNTGWNDPPEYMDNKRFYPFYEKCQELGAVLKVISSLYMGPDFSYVGAIRLQHIAADFPYLLIVVGHGGWPFVMDFLGLAFMYPNVWLAPDFYCFRAGVPGASHYVEAANFYLADRFLFASAYPPRRLKQSVEEFRQLPLRPEVLEKALYKNAQWILGDRKE